MSQAQAAAAVDRLPWLEDEPKPAPPRPARARGGGPVIAGWALTAILLVAGISYWLGVHSSGPAPVARPAQTSTAIPAPRPKVEAPAQPQVALEPQPQVRPAPVREVPIARPRTERRSYSRHVSAPPRREHRPSALQKVVAAQKAAPPALNPVSKPPTTNPLTTKPLTTKPLTLWPASRSEGARGRIIRIGAFGTRQQAKLGWRHMVRAYPAVAHLPATVVEVRNSRGRPFYRFQIGTTSQAHSEVLCQRMGRIRFSCAVVGLPWKPSGVER